MSSLEEKRISPDQVFTGSFPEHVENWEEYFLWVAEAVAIKSKDPRCRVGAVIASKENLIIATGFNGLARRVHDSEILLADAEEKLKVICHAEVNAIFNAARFGIPLASSSIFVTKFPCLSCCNAIIQAGIGRIYTHDNCFWDDDPWTVIISTRGLCFVNRELRWTRRTIPNSSRAGLRADSLAKVLPKQRICLYPALLKLSRKQISYQADGKQ